MIARFTILIALFATTSLANDGWIGYSGAPRIEGQHPTIRMVDEVIHLKVGGRVLYGECVFTFKNEGPACTARIGFPDYDSNRESDEGLISTFRSFRSYVDGRQVSTKLVAGSQGSQWQVKNVYFARGQTRLVRNVYHLNLGRITLNGPSVQGREPIIWEAEYILGTGNTWRGKIGKTTIIVDFGSEAQIQSPIEPRKWPGNERAENSEYWIKDPRLVVWGAPSAPRVAGKRRLVFEMKNWKPDAEGDDLSLRFGVHGKSWSGD